MSRATAELPDAWGHRKRTSRQVRHAARMQLHQVILDQEALDDVDVLCPKARHDLGRHASPPPPRTAKPGRRSGFKVWKTPFWKRRRGLWEDRNRAARQLS